MSFHIVQDVDQRPKRKGTLHSDTLLPNSASRPRDTSSCSSTLSTLALPGAPSALRIFLPLFDRYAFAASSGPAATTFPVPSRSFPAVYSIANIPAASAPAITTGGATAATTPVPTARAILAPPERLFVVPLLFCSSWCSFCSRRAGSEPTAVLDSGDPERVEVGLDDADAELASECQRRAGSVSGVVVPVGGVGDRPVSYVRWKAEEDEAYALASSSAAPYGTGGSGVSTGAVGAEAEYAGGGTRADVEGGTSVDFEAGVRSGSGSFSLFMPMPEIIVVVGVGGWVTEDGWWKWGLEDGAR
ncbi:uncharacterized protein BXZ73DRAFT_103290 [Epithele typhae]|uniref:uncharacterized protein n=1 Tax=Epithele typhae TaxID=378194 RepID=UPI0020078956|nr:uncharacterized protein BXZ73DRAFT_103290 [Epithele typhae]KAH9925410.1 hypothetical protein BXZ73DRAFT_103290 [Epithele typhae]